MELAKAVVQTTHDHLSYSQIYCYLGCPLQYRFKYVDDIPPAFTTAALVFGSAIHEAAAAFHQGRLEAEPLRVDQLLDVYRDEWRRAERVKFLNGDNENTLMEKARNMLSVFHDSVDSGSQVIGVEEFFEIPLGGLPPFQGYIDLIEESHDGCVTLVDLKTASKKLSQSNVDTNLQLTAYALATESMGFNPDDLTFRLDVLLKTKEAGMVRYETRRTADDRHRFMRLLYSVWNGIQQEVFFPRQDWGCIQCAWAKNCRDW
ncbi:RecB family exonuclease [Desulfomonile tiedjei]|uniref:RecB family exonuclease n=1 Tax=Desulfomonile tiedjei (strain ATCC 49306 / DSM 6799 / DCB-1) TaxID=706587 RepID=I4C974_DESTA|nr:PD-(D/E)XK nuclease family protein [Desulfomonile tiedjei]AFM26115.1 RecB family exonuclease [Desulfomonile tiedjei DSM 6799]